MYIVTATGATLLSSVSVVIHAITNGQSVYNRLYRNICQYYVLTAVTKIYDVAYKFHVLNVLARLEYLLH
uniref:Putative secreted protein n=1 Tax=Amblyomma cajennense TaxID=34607 RepID=A0A023FCZ8_AMBCJ